MIRKRICISIFLGFLFFTSSLSFPSNWFKTFGIDGQSWAKDTTVINDGSIIVVGRVKEVGTWDNNIWILKLTEKGNVVWEKTYGSEKSVGAESVVATSDGGFIIAGRYMSSEFGEDLLVMKLDKDGNVQWTKLYGEANGELATSIINTKDGGFIVTGYTKSFGAGSTDALILKLKSDGEIEWQRSYGREYRDELYSIKETSDGGYIALGKKGTGIYAINHVIWLLKLKPNGFIEWELAYYADSSRQEYAESILATPDGGYILCGATTAFDPRNIDWLFSEGSCGFFGCFDIWVLKLNNSGEIEWHKAYGSDDADYGNSILPMDDGYLIGGNRVIHTDEYHENHCYIKIDFNGNPLWHKRVNTGKTRSKKTIKYKSKGFLTFGINRKSSDENSLDEYLVLKVNSAGTIPNCNRIEDMSLSVRGGNCFVYETNVLTGTSSIIPREGNILSITTNSSKNTICYFNSSPPSDTTYYETTFCEEHPTSVICFFKKLFKSMEIYNIQFNYPISEEDVKFEIGTNMKRLYSEMFIDFFSEEYKFHTYETNKDNLILLLEEINHGEFFDLKTKQLILHELKASSEISTKLLEKLFHSLNLIELDLKIPKFKKLEVTRARSSKFNFKGVVLGEINHMSKPGVISLSMKENIPVMKKGFISTWPLVSYNFTSDIKLSNDGYINLNFSFSGITHLGKDKNLRIMEWDGKLYKDITLKVDVKKKTISGRTKELKSYVILSINKK